MYIERGLNLPAVHNDVVCPMGAGSRDMKDMEVQPLETLRRLVIDPLTLDNLSANPMDSPGPLAKNPSSPRSSCAPSRGFKTQFCRWRWCCWYSSFISGC